MTVIQGPLFQLVKEKQPVASQQLAFLEMYLGDMFIFGTHIRPTIKYNLTCENRDIPKRNLSKSSVAAAPADSKSCPNRPGKEKTGQVGLTSDGLLAATSYSASRLLGPTYYLR
ncbi:hypothetical protein NPIL_612131 [Nephila pilipes]|uniref:Uncharacterized protein n=1 Tax=Nephila pilipes TaxID=299642 RepID=A0A8X6U3H5_NEPPI|nr:hypothetical protein NPIL_612131 [Nephila pilipes]